MVEAKLMKKKTGDEAKGECEGKETNEIMQKRQKRRVHHGASRRKLVTHS